MKSLSTEITIMKDQANELYPGAIGVSTSSAYGLTKTWIA